MVTQSIDFTNIGEEIDLEHVEQPRKSSRLDVNGLPIQPSGFVSGLGKLDDNQQRMVLNVVARSMEPGIVLVGEWLNAEERTDVERVQGLALAIAHGLPDRPFGTWLSYRSSFDRDAEPFSDLAILQLRDGSCIGFRGDEDGTGQIASIYRRVGHVVRGNMGVFRPEPPVFNIWMPGLSLFELGRKVYKLAGIAWKASEWMEQ